MNNIDKYFNLLSESGIFVDDHVVGTSVVWRITGNTLNEIASLIDNTVVIPQFVADFIEDLKEKGGTLHEATDLDNMYVQTHHPKVFKWQLHESAEKQEIIAKAWLNGYEIENEILYTAKLNISKVVDWSTDDEYYFNTNSDLSTDNVWVSSSPVALPMIEWINRAVTDDIATFEESEY